MRKKSAKAERRRRKKEKDNVDALQAKIRAYEVTRVCSTHLGRLSYIVCFCDVLDFLSRVVFTCVFVALSRDLVRIKLTPLCHF